ncbi:MAG: glycoside hydrolase family 2 protein, partial [Phycisphaeraceae bacterium]
MRRKQLEMSWTVGFAASLEAAPEKRVPATVPGAVQLDWARAHGWPGHTFADNYRQYGWMADVYWSYQADTALPQPGEDERLFFVCQGVDYQFQVRLAGEVLLEQEGMFTPVELDLTDKVRPGAKLEVLVFPAPKAHDAPADRTQARLSCKPAAAYTWDWHPRLIPLGIWDETCLELRPAVHLADAETSYELADDLGSAAVRADVRLSEPGRGTIRWRLLDPDGERVLEETADADAERRTLEQTVARPRLWWPHTEGEQPLYRSVVELLSEGGEVLDRRESRVGFRQVRLVMAPGQWEEPAGFPKGRSNPPITLEINGRAIFARGSNWVPPSVFPGTIDAATYRPLLELVRGAHMNILRSWGGGIVNKAAFFELCDEMGLLVWQEFPLACNDYPDDPAYLRVLDRESRSIIRRLRRHACLAIWCGGNELFNSWSGMTDQSLALRL